MKDVKTVLKFLNAILLFLFSLASVINTWVVFYFLKNHELVTKTLALTNQVWLYYVALGVGIPLLLILLGNIVYAIFNKGKTYSLTQAERRREKLKEKK